MIGICAIPPLCNRGRPDDKLLSRLFVRISIPIGKFLHEAVMGITHFTARSNC
jgi:hypothetical protein